MSTCLTVFDLDHTLIKVNASYAFGHYLYHHKQLSLRDLLYCLTYYFMHKQMGMSIQTLHEKVFNRAFLGKNALIIEGLVQQFLDKYLQGMINDTLQALMNERKRCGDTIAILSSSPDFLVKAIGKRFQADYCIGTPYLIDPSDRFFAISQVINGEDKALWTRTHAQDKGISLNSIRAFTDSHLDLPLLESAGEAYVVNPDRRLLKISRSRGWKIISKE